jgi:hypothetical protein
VGTHLQWKPNCNDRQFGIIKAKFVDARFVGHPVEGVSTKLDHYWLQFTKGLLRVTLLTK